MEKLPGCNIPGQLKIMVENMENLNTDIKYAIEKYREWLKIAGIILENKLINIDDEIIENFEMIKSKLSEMENIIGVEK